MTTSIGMTATFVDQMVSSRLVNWVATILLHFLWQGAVIAALYGSISRVVRSNASSLRYGLSCVALLGMVIAPLMTGFILRSDVFSGNPRWIASRASTQSEGQLVDDFPATATPDAEIRSAAFDSAAAASSAWTSVASPLLSHWIHALANRYSSGLVAGWLIGVALCTLRLLLSLRAVAVLRRSGTAILDKRLLATFAELIERLGITSGNIRLMQSTSVTIPTAIGWIRPVVLLPVAFLTRLSLDQIEAILAHELAHIKRHDYLINLLQRLAETVLFYHPAVWWISNTIRNERELCCDEIAIRMIVDPELYAKTLFELASVAAVPTQLSMSATGGNLKDRIARILDVPKPTSSGTGPVVALAFGLIVMFSAAISQQSKANDPIDEKPVTALEAEKKTPSSDASATDLKHAHRVTFVRTRHVLMHEGRIITRDEVDPIIEAAIAKYQKIQPAFLETHGALAIHDEVQKEMKDWWQTSYARYYQEKKLDSVSMGTISPRASPRYDRIENAADLVPDESTKLSGVIKGVDGKPVRNVEVILLPAFFHGGIYVHLQDGKLRDPHDEHLVHSDEAGRFATYPDFGEVYIAAVHPDGFYFGEFELLKEKPTIELQPWARIHGSVLIEDDTKQSMNFCGYATNDIQFNVWETKINEEGEFDERFLPPGKVLVQRGLNAGTLGILFNLNEWLLEPGESQEVIVGPIPEQQKRMVIEREKRGRKQ